MLFRSLTVVSETVAQGTRQHLTEKTFKPICQQTPFILVATSGALEYLRSYGFRTFDSVWDESYDLEPDTQRRVARIGQLLQELNELDQPKRQHLYEQAIPIVQHNFNHFYGGGFERILQKEMAEMICAISRND